MMHIQSSFAIFAISLFIQLPAFAAEALCAHPLVDSAAPAHFSRLARLQMALEYGAAGIDIRKIELHPVDRDVVRVDAIVQVTKVEAGNPASFWITGWLSRCQGTLIVRGNTWLADGRLVTPRFTVQQIPGRGLVLGKDDAPLHVIAFVDSRCPHCHRLIGYARELLKKGALRIEFRQVAYLETAIEAIKDGRLYETELFNTRPGALGVEDYLDMVGELNSTLEIDAHAPDYEKALALIQTNTNTAHDVLHVSAVPAVLVLDKKSTGEYRLTGLNEMNRIFQPDL
ncbi:MAG: thioredoxin domain-containing protein [Gammaproteobacteria bacterium]|nr:thioredoxin domain-containing protein [Gammaproteobacteria bacterium]